MDESSSIGFRQFETRDTINRNHVNMCRFHGRDDEHYRMFLGAFRSLLSYSLKEAEKLEKFDQLHEGSSKTETSKCPL